jgi:AraC family transcriptional regulator, ethanolamine operon transcriptional activator
MISMGSLSRRAPADWRWSLMTNSPHSNDRSAAPLGFHDYARSICEPGANFMLTRPSRSRWEFSSCQLGNAVLQSGATGGATIADGVSKSDSFVFVLRHSDHSCPVTLNGEVAGVNDIAVFPPRREFVVASQGPHNWISHSVPVWVLGEAGLSQAQLHALGAAASLIPAQPDIVRQLVAAATNAMDLAQDSPTPANASRHDDIEQGLLADLLAVLVQNVTPAKASSSRNRSFDRVVSQALAFLRAHDGQDLHVKRLCRAINVAERSLLRAFHQFVGVGPTQYLKLRRLNQVHHALQAADCGEATVTEILTTCGVTELGRFAGIYRELFGESPSETLKANAYTNGRINPFPETPWRGRQAGSAARAKTAWLQAC